MAVELPQEIQLDLDLFTLNDQLRTKRSDFALAVSRMESQAYSIKKQFRNLVDDMISIIDQIISKVETAVIPKADFTGFEAGTVTLDEHGSFDILNYYGEINKLKLSLYGINVALLQIDDTNAIPLTPALSINANEGTLDTLDENEFIEQGYENPVTELTQNFNYYTIMQNDTLHSIAAKVYSGDSSRWVEISRANNLRDSDLVGNQRLGETIKIPRGTGGNNLFDNNLVYEKTFDNNSQKSIDRFNYGRDITLVEGKIQVDSENDLKWVEGINGVVENIKDRFDNTKTALNPLNPSWGLEPLGNFGNIPFPILLDRVLINMEAQAAEDGRVVSATIDRAKLDLKRDRLDVEMEILLIGSQIEKTSFRVPPI